MIIKDVIDQNAKIILEFMQLNMEPEKADIIIGLGSKETRVADKCAELYIQGYSNLIIFSGGLGKITKQHQKTPEADIFKTIAINQGVPKDKILVENKSNNTGENVIFSWNILNQHKLKPKSLIVVTKPYMERRAFAAFKKLWSDNSTQIIVTSPNLSYEEHFSQNYDKDEFINIMVGDLQRIKEFPKLGFQIEQTIPNDVWLAYERLIDLGYTKQLLKS